MRWSLGPGYAGPLFFITNRDNKMISKEALLSINQDGTYELQFTNSDDADRLVLVCGECSPCCREKKDSFEGGDLSVREARQILNTKTLLDATDLTSVAALLSEYSIRCFAISYYAIVRISNSKLIAEHFLYETPERSAIYHETQGSCDSRIRARNYA